MKKALLLLTLTFLLSGCMNLKESSYEDIIASALENKKMSFHNTTSQGYNYYLPRGLIVLEDQNNNITLKSEKYNLYLYVDLISYYNKIGNNYQVNSSSYYSQSILNNDKFGYVEINLRENDKYLIEIMYNYAKIEVIVNNKDIKEMLSYAISLLSSISYNDKIIENMIGEDILNYNENEYNIFETASSDVNLKYDQEELEEEREKIDANHSDVPDTDLIN